LTRKDLSPNESVQVSKLLLGGIRNFKTTQYCQRTQENFKSEQAPHITININAQPTPPQSHYTSSQESFPVQDNNTPDNANTEKNSDQKDVLEIKDASIIFSNVWNKIENKYGRENMRFPKEIIWLMGAPGSGKSFNAPYILMARGITAPEVVMSSLLTSPEAEKIKREAGLVGDSLVVEILLEKLLQPEYANGVLVDGFPRTQVQVECIKLLKEQMLKLRQEFVNTELGPYFRRPVYRVAVLFVDEKGSVERQLKRGREAREYNQKVRETGVGELVEERPTDFSEELARRRYAVFKNHYSTLQELQKHFAFSVVNTKAPVEEVQANIMKEFMYQSSLELGEETNDAIQKIPIVKDITKHARQNLVRRLDNYQTRHADIFYEAVNIIQKDFVPVLEKHAMAGHAQIRTQNKFFENEIAVDTVLDILSERGFHATAFKLVQHIPKRIDLNTGDIQNEQMTTYVFDIRFKHAALRLDDDAKQI